MTLLRDSETGVQGDEGLMSVSSGHFFCRFRKSLQRLLSNEPSLSLLTISRPSRKKGCPMELSVYQLPQDRSNHGVFTLIELLVVISIIAVLIAAVAARRTTGT